MIKKYLRPLLGQEVAAPAGYYLPQEEGLLFYKGKQVLYVLGSVCIESACCGVGMSKGGWNYIQVPGYLVGEEKDSAACDIETVEDESDRLAIIRLLREKYPQARIEF
ncbi:MAG: hypothetical protein H6Q39_544 [Chloroflexi bacterium]|nr:hypothetical protein [Chloroflexota bacterium]